MKTKHIVRITKDVAELIACMKKKFYWNCNPQKLDLACPNCGQMVASDSTFCRKCGKVTTKNSCN